MKYAYNINGGRLRYMHIKLVESENTLRFRIRDNEKTLEIKISHFNEFIESSANCRCGEIGLMIADIVNEIDDVVQSTQKENLIKVWNTYYEGDDLLHALHALICDLFEVES